MCCAPKCRGCLVRSSTGSAEPPLSLGRANTLPANCHQTAECYLSARCAGLMNPHSNVLSKLQSWAASQPLSLFLTPLLSLCPSSTESPTSSLHSLWLQSLLKFLSSTLIPEKLGCCGSSHCVCCRCQMRCISCLCPVFSWINVEKDLQVVVFCLNLIFYTASQLFLESRLPESAAHCLAASQQINCFWFTLSALMFSATAGGCFFVCFLRNSSKNSPYTSRQTQLVNSEELLAAKASDICLGRVGRDQKWS